MWILDQAQDNFQLLIAATGRVVQFQHKEGSFTLGQGQLHEYQGQGAYALRNEKAELVEDSSWLGYGSERGTFGRMAHFGGTSSYFQPIYDYSGGKPVFTQWRYITVSYGKPEWRYSSGDNVPYIVSGGYAAAVWIGAKLGISLECPPLGAALAAWSLITAVDNLQVNTADRVNDQYVDWTPPPSGPHPASTALQNPNGIGYPAP